MKKRKVLPIIMISAMLMTGCSMRFSAEENAVYVNKNGEIVGAIVEKFDKEYYDQEELKSILDQKVVEYNAENGKNSIEIETYKQSGDELKIIINYSNWSDYTHFNQVQFFSGNIADIQEKSYGDNLTFYARDGVNTIAFDEIDQKYNVVLLEEKIVVQTAGKIAYVSENVTIEGDKLARVNEDASGLAYIVYEK